MREQKDRYEIFLVVSRTLLEYLKSTRQRKDTPQIK